MNGSYYKTKNADFETYKISNRLNLSGNLTQVFQYVIRRNDKHKSPAEDIAKAIEFVRFEVERIFTAEKFFYAQIEKNIDEYLKFLKDEDRHAYDVLCVILRVIETCHTKPQECNCGRNNVSDKCKVKIQIGLSELQNLLQKELRRVQD
jgi:hypothetical protein